MPVVRRGAEPSDDLCDFFIRALAEAGRSRRRTDGGEGRARALSRGNAERSPERPRFVVVSRHAADEAPIRA